MNETSPNAYLRTKVMTAGPAELRMMLFEGAIKFAEQGRCALEQQQYDGAYNALTRAQAIVMELINSLQPQHDPELCSRLSALYTYIYGRMVAAGHEQKPQLIEEALDLLRFERDTWSMVLEQLAAENRKAKALKETPEVDEVPPGSPRTTNPLVGGRVSVRG